MVKLSHFKLAFIIIGSVVGAGFITGKELIRFFGSQNFIPAVYTACILLFFFSYLLMDIGRRYGSIKAANDRVFKKYAKLVSALTYPSLMVIGAGMVAGIDSLLNTAFGLPNWLPVFGIISIILCNLVCGKGLDGLAKISIVLVPLMIAFILYFLLGRKNFSYTFAESYDGFSGIIMAVFYASMNMFLAAPVLIDAGNRYKYGLKTGAAVSGGVLFFCIILILSAICFEGSNAIAAEMPMVYITGTTGLLAGIFTFIVFCAMFTSLTSSFYPLHSALEGKKHVKIKRFILFTGAFALSRIGLSGIVQYFYPVLGVLGVVYLAVLALYMTHEKQLLLPLDGKLFKKRNQRVHTGGKYAQNNRA